MGAQSRPAREKAVSKDRGRGGKYADGRGCVGFQESSSASGQLGDTVSNDFPMSSFETFLQSGYVLEQRFVIQRLLGAGGMGQLHTPTSALCTRCFHQ